MPRGIFKPKYECEDLHRPLDPSRLAQVDLNEGRIVRQDGAVLCGSCSRCGTCCMQAGVPFPNADKTKCKRLRPDQTKSDGSNTFKCSVYRIRPLQCALWPEVDDEMPPECTYYWVKVR